MKLLAALVALVALAVGSAQAAPAPFERAQDKITEALRLERLAYERLQNDRKDPEIERLLRRSLEILAEVQSLPNLPASVSKLVSRAQAADESMLTLLPTIERYRAWVPNFTLGIGILAKDDALEDLEDASWKATQQKAATPVRVEPPRCRSGSSASARAAVVLPGCTGGAFWSIFVPASARRAKCTFRGPRGLVDAARPLFPGTAQQRICRFAGFRNVGGERKRVVRAELRITVPPEAKAAAPRVVRVAAHWR